MPFDIFLLWMHFESFKHAQNIPTNRKMCQNVWNAHEIPSECLECTSIVQECTTNFDSNGIPAHSESRVTRV